MVMGSTVNYAIKQKTIAVSSASRRKGLTGAGVEWFGGQSDLEMPGSGDFQYHRIAELRQADSVEDARALCLLSDAEAALNRVPSEDAKELSDVADSLTCGVGKLNTTSVRLLTSSLNI